MGLASQLGLRVVVVLIAISVPVFLVVETLLRVYVLGPLYGPVLTELAALHWPQTSLAEIGARATAWAWALIAITCVAGVIGVVVLRATVRRALSRTDDRPAQAKVRDQLLLLTSIPQVPGLLSTLCFAAGAALAPVLICVAVSTAFVVAQGFIGERLLERYGEPGEPGEPRDSSDLAAAARYTGASAPEAPPR